MKRICFLLITVATLAGCSNKPKQLSPAHLAGTKWEGFTKRNQIGTTTYTDGFGKEHTDKYPFYDIDYTDTFAIMFTSDSTCHIKRKLIEYDASVARNMYNKDHLRLIIVGIAALTGCDYNCYFETDKDKKVNISVDNYHLYQISDGKTNH